MAKAHTYSKTSLILSLFFWVPALNIFTAILAIVFGVAALKDLKGNKDMKSKGLAIAGITVGIITLILSFVGLLLYPELYLGTNSTLSGN